MAMAALGANLSASFPERINSAAKLILTPGRSGLPDLCLERCVILRINKKFIYHMKEKWPRQPGAGRLVMTAAQQKCFDKIAVEDRFFESQKNEFEAYARYAAAQHKLFLRRSGAA
jgi:hypothetical protein